MNSYPRLDRSGMSLIEVVIALTIMSIALIALGGLMFQVAQQTRDSAAATYRTAAAQRGSSWIQALPWDSLKGAAGCTADSCGSLAYNRCITVADSTVTVKLVTMVITPTGVFTARPDTLTVYRNKPRGASVFR